MGSEKVFSQMMKDIVSGKGLMEGNKAINAITKNGLGGFEAIGRMINGEDASMALAKTFKHGIKDGMTKEEIAAAKYNMPKIAGSYIGMAAGYRVLSGGGVTRDKNGNPNLIGVPFV